MKFRSARHTTNLQNIISFYTQLIGLEVLGDFTAHDGYDGVFIGKPGASWHLEFTTSPEAPVHQPDEDDLLVFYPETEEEFDWVMQRFEQEGIEPVLAKNPYWNAHGITYIDPDGYRVVISKDQLI